MKNQKGITLIALVITIIVLLILAGVSIAMLTGENGILTKADTASTKRAIAEVDEAIRLGLDEILANKMDPTFNNTEVDSNGVSAEVNETNLKKAIQQNNSKLLNDTKLQTSKDSDVKVTYNYNGKDYEWVISSEGKITTSPEILTKTSNSSD